MPYPYGYIPGPNVIPVLAQTFEPPIREKIPEVVIEPLPLTQKQKLERLNDEIETIFRDELLPLEEDLKRTQDTLFHLE